MQPYSKLLIVLPCHSMEDFPTHHRGSEAADLLAAWTSIWHPALIAGSQAIPIWHQADNPELNLDPENSNPLLVVIPAITQPVIDSQLQENLQSNSAIVIDDTSSREQIIQSALQSNPASAKLAEQVDPDLAEDFLALGYAFLQTQIMTRQLRYSSNLDEAQFSDAVVAAAQTAVEGDHEKTTEGLTRCFDILLEEKNSYYPVEPELMDVVLTAPTTLGKSLTRQLAQDHPFNVLLTGRNARHLAEKHPENLATLKQLVADQHVTIIGGLEDELPDPLLSSETQVNQIRLGRKTIGEFLDTEPAVFLRRRFGLTPSTPGILSQFNFSGAVHATFDDGKFPPSSSCNIRWTGDDDASILAFGDVPLSAADAGSFLGFGIRLGEAIDSAHIASVILVHWPDATCEAFEDLVRITSYSPIFGKFVSSNDYFDSIYDPGYGDTYTADEYKSPYLKQAVDRATPNPISRVTAYWNRFYKISACRSLLTQACARHPLTSQKVEETQSRLADLQTEIERQLNVEGADDAGIDDQIETLTQEIKTLGLPDGTAADAGGSRPASNGRLQLINPTSFKRRVELKTETGKTGTLKQAPPVILCDSGDSGAQWLVEIPAMGTAEINLQSPDAKDHFKSDPKVSGGLLLRNEFFELQVDEGTGGVRGIQIYGERGNLGSQQLAMRIPSPKSSGGKPLSRARYTQMVADKIQPYDQSRLWGAISSSGRLLDGDQEVARFQQSIRVARGKRVIEFEVELEPKIELTQSINHYICSRLAWKDESARVIANTQETQQQVTSDWFHATNFLSIVQEQHRVTLLTGGLPYHRRASRRMVDSLLMVGQEQQRKFRFGIGVDLPYALAAAQDWMTPSIVAPGGNMESGKNESGWLFHFDCKNILATWWQPIFDDDSHWTGVQIRLRETEGRQGSLGIYCPREIASGERVTFAGDFKESLRVAKTDASKLEIEFDRFEFLQISIHWKR
jgi:alpha-mannosidase